MTGQQVVDGLVASFGTFGQGRTSGGEYGNIKSNAQHWAFPDLAGRRLLQPKGLANSGSEERFSLWN
jgi:hypothetical protein